MSIISYTEKQGTSSAVDLKAAREAMLACARGLLSAWLWNGTAGVELWESTNPCFQASSWGGEGKGDSEGQSYAR